MQWCTPAYSVFQKKKRDEGFGVFYQLLSLVLIENLWKQKVRILRIQIFHSKKSIGLIYTPILVKQIFFDFSNIFVYTDIFMFMEFLKWENKHNSDFFTLFTEARIQIKKC